MDPTHREVPTTDAHFQELISVNEKRNIITNNVQLATQNKKMDNLKHIYHQLRGNISKITLHDTDDEIDQLCPKLEVSHKNLKIEQQDFKIKSWQCKHITETMMIETQEITNHR